MSFALPLAGGCDETHLKSSIGGSAGRNLPRISPDSNAILAYFTPADNPCEGDRGEF